MINGRVTQADVAKKAGVSRFTVSCVVNNLSGGNVRISDETRQRVLEAVDQLGYIPDRNARSLRTRKTNTIAGIIPDITNPFYPTVERAIQTVAEANGYDLIVYNTDGRAEKELKSLRSAQQNMVDGAIVFLFALDTAYLNELLDKNISVIYIDNPHSVTFQSDRAGYDVIGIDDVQAAKEGVTYLIDRGFRQIGILTGPIGPPRRRRMVGFQEALQARGLPVEDRFIAEGCDYTEIGGQEAMRDLLSRPVLPQAIFTINDLMAMGAMIALREAGLRIPEDIAILGFDDIPAARLVSPALTTIRHNQELLGKTAATMLIERLTSDLPIPKRIVEIPHSFIQRQSA
jgi:LacI family transcriptional regulator